jgi:Tfp pilus assembly protein FimT
MATRNDRSRRGQRGLSIIEALVIMTITALLALTLLPLVSGSAERNYERSRRELDSADAARASAMFRTMVSASVSVGILAAEDVSLGVSLPSALSCARAGRGIVTLRITAQRELVCISAQRRSVLLRWREGNARFGFSADGRTWVDAWRGDDPPRYIRFDLDDARRDRLTWVASLAEAERGERVRS